ncbi:hypothetical protein [Nonomuraea typhae]|uniref:Uncharacterized protein n=1 Tax=Nonomuraea typhae TaxID=2603600 RepID=A0ABW7Z889_9ACTN
MAHVVPGEIRAAQRLVRALEPHGIAADIHDGYGLALVSVWIDLVVWTDGLVYRWWSGSVSGGSGRRVYAACPADAPETAARRIALRNRMLQQTHPPCAPTRREAS